VAAGVLISTFLNAFLLIPALTGLLGRKAWWPSRDRPPAPRQPTLAQGNHGTPFVLRP
jgi:uncharacterized membrane protein YdfJ with MMPL/SSD domain